MIELAENRYGKSRVRLMKVKRTPKGNELREWTVQVLLTGDFDTAHYDGDNSKILPTDTMKNTAAAELLEAAEQQRQITQLRLRRWLGAD